MPDTAARRATARAAVLEHRRRAGATGWIQAGGDSMRPLVTPGDWLCVDFGAAAALGDVVVATSADGRQVAHRVVALRDAGGLLVTKGDAEPYCDAPVPAGDVLGVVRAVAATPDPASRDAVTTTLGDRRGLVLARASHVTGRLAGRARRVALRLPSPRRAAALRAVAGVALAASRGSAAIALRGTVRQRSTGGR